MNGYFNAEIALKIGGPGSYYFVLFIVLQFYRISLLKSVTMLQLNQKQMNTCDGSESGCRFQGIAILIFNFVGMFGSGSKFRFHKRG